LVQVDQTVISYEGRRMELAYLLQHPYIIYLKSLCGQCRSVSHGGAVPGRTDGQMAGRIYTAGITPMRHGRRQSSAADPL